MSRQQILYVEDEALLAFPVELSLIDAGYEVTTVSSSNHAIAMLRDGAHRFDCLLTDIRLPGGVDGWAIADLARGLFPDMPVIYASGDSAKDWKDKGVSRSVMLTKPFPLEDVIRAVKRALAPPGL